MADLRPETGGAPRGDAVWQDDNERGLRLAIDGEWEEAREAFATAADSLARSLPGNAPAHEPLALVLGNLAQASFRAGHHDDAVQHQKRACALRVAIAGEDGMPVARARMDLAVMLAAVGRLEEANALVQRAIAALDHRVGEDDARLAIVLENAARIAIASGAPANAEPLLLRLHALLDAHELSTARADALLARVAAVRAGQAAAARPASDADAQATSLPLTAEAPRIDAERLHETVEQAGAPPEAFDAERPVYAHASIETSEWEDQPLRDAVAVTDVLLRNTPAGVPAITPRHGLLDTPVGVPPLVPPASPANAPAPPDDPDALSLELADFDFAADATSADADGPDTAPPLAGEAPASADLATDIADDIMATLATPSAARPGHDSSPARETLDLDLALDDAFTTPDTAPAADTFGEITLADEYSPRADAGETPAAVAPPGTEAPVGGLLLDFTVQHGTLDDADGVPSMEAPPITVPVPHALTPVLAAPAQPPAPPLAVVNAGSADGVAPLSDLVGTAPPTAHAATDERAGPAERVAAPAAAPPAAARPARRDGEPTKSRALIPIVIGAVAAIGGVAAYLLTR